MTAGAAVWWALVAVEAAALALAARSTFRDPVNKSRSGQLFAANPLSTLTALLALALANELTIEVIHHVLAGAPRPFVGAVRAAYHLETALVLAWPAALAVASWRCFSAPRWDHRRGRIRRPVPAWWATVVVAGCWCGCLLALVVAHPLGREATARALGAFEVGAVVAALAAVPLGWRRPWGVAHVGVGLLVAVELAVAMIGPWVRDIFHDWPIASAGYLVGFGALAAYLLASWLRGPARR